jgi:hypothetical protein
MPHDIHWEDFKASKFGREVLGHKNKILDILSDLSDTFCALCDVKAPAEILDKLEAELDRLSRASNSATEIWSAAFSAYKGDTCIFCGEKPEKCDCYRGPIVETDEVNPHLAAWNR